jgi:predicted ArsR family transcriptional regulator
LHDAIIPAAPGEFRKDIFALFRYNSSMPTVTSRHRILEYLEGKLQPVSAEEIGRALKMTSANARHHLALLTADGRVMVAGQLAPKARGRPQQLYSPASRAASHNLGGLACALLAEVFERTAPEAHPSLLAELAERMLADAPAPAGPLRQRLTHAIQRLNQWHYAAGWEARPEGPRITLGHCPYGAVQPRFPVLCQLDALLLQQALGLPVIQKAQREPDARGVKTCVFAAGSGE